MIGIELFKENYPYHSHRQAFSQNGVQASFEKHFSNIFKGPLKYLLVPLLGKNQLAITLHMYASIGPNLDNTHWGQI